MTTLVTDLAQDLRYTARQLRRAPFFSLTIIGTVAIAVGAPAVMFGVLRATLLHPLPYPHPEQLIEAGDKNLRGFEANGLMALLRTDDLAHLTRDGRPLFPSLGFFYSDDSTLTLTGETPLRVPAAAVSGTFFPTLAAPALLGRTLGPADDLPNGPQLIVLSYRLWQTAFAGDPHVLGRTVRLGADQATVVGVMPPQFAVPAAADLWHPGHIFPASFRGYRGDGSRFLQVIARLGPAIPLPAARAATTELAARLARAYPETDAAWGFTLTDLRTGLFGQFRRALELLTAAVVLVLLAAVVNIAGLQLSRTAARQGELSVRVALGIGRIRLARLLAVETLTPIFAGGVTGIALAAALLRLLVAHLPPALFLVDRPHIDAPVIALALTITLAMGLLTAVAPMLQTARLRSAAPVAAGRSVVGRTRSLGRALSALQIALALVLLTLSSAVLLNLYHLLSTPLGFDRTHIETFSVDLPWGADPAKSHRLYAQLEQRFTDLPGVESAGAITALPLADFSLRRHFDIAGQPATANHDTVVAAANTFSPGYLRTLRIPLLAGRTFDPRDFETNAPRVLVVNKTLADRYFHGANAIGKHLQTSSADLHVAPGSDKHLIDAGEIIGITGDIRGTGGPVDRAVQPEVDTPEDGGWPHMQFALRLRDTPTSQTSADLTPDAAFQTSIRNLVTGLDGTASPGHFTTLNATLGRALAQPRLNAALLTAFAALSLLLVILGVYSLVAFDVAGRTRELALRLALGATRAGILRLVLHEATRILAVGLAAGLAASFAVSRLLTAFSFEAGNPGSPLLLLAAAALLATAVLLATLVPARRAAMVDPMEALRSE